MAESVHGFLIRSYLINKLLELAILRKLRYCETAIT